MLTPQPQNHDDHAGLGPQSSQTDLNPAAPQCDPEPPWTPPTFAPAPDLRAMMDEILTEESTAFEERLRHWCKLADPRTDFEEFLVRIIVNLSFELERAIKAYEAELKTHVESAVENELLTVHELSRQLFFDAASGSPALYGLDPDPFNPRKTSSNGLPNDPLDPAVLVKKLTSTGAGCRHLRQVWCDLRCRLDLGKFWQSPDRLKAVRMCGHNPADAIEHERIARLFVASFPLEKRGDQPDSAWEDLLSDMGKPTLEKYRERVSRRFPNFPSAHEGLRHRKFLIDLVEENIASLSVKVEMHDANTRAKAEQTVARLSFDQTPVGESIRRSKSRCLSDIFKAIDRYKKIRNKHDSLPATGGTTKPEPPAPDQTSVDSLASMMQHIEQQLCNFESEVASPGAIPAQATASQHHPDATPLKDAAPPQPAAKAATTSAARPSDPFAGMSRRAKRKAQKALQRRKRERPSPPSPVARPPAPPPTAIPTPKRPDITNPDMSIPELDLPIQGLRAQLEAMNATVRKLLATSPDAVQHLSTLLKPAPKKPGPPAG
jgi:hypothetical protein